MVKRILLILAFCCLLSIPAWLVWVAPYLIQLPVGFTYQANLLSLDNFYNAEVKKFEGEHITKSQFGYRVIAKKKDYLLIENSFSVRTLSDNPIFSVIRLYSINPYSLSHVKSTYSDRAGYLFGPRFENKKDFQYWHINYNAPATMQYSDKDVIDGLTVYHYIANYQADQTENLRGLPDVPSKFGVRTFITLHLWVEPISGWLVKYQDHSTAYFYDKNTGQITHAWNKFSNRYTPISIDAQVKQARYLKYKILFVYFGVPLLLTLLMLLLLYLAYFPFELDKITIGWRLSSFYQQNRASLVILLLLFTFFFSWQIIFGSRAETRHYRIGISTWNSNPDFQQTVQGFKDELHKLGFIEGKNTTFIIKNPNNNIENQINIIQDFVKNNVNLIFTLSTTGTLIAKGITSDIPIVFSEVSHPVETGIIHSTVSSKNNLVGTRNYLPAALVFYQLDKFNFNLKTIHYIHQQGDPDNEIQWREYKNLLKDRNINLIDIGFIDENDLAKKLIGLKTDAIILSCDSLVQSGAAKLLLDLAIKNKIPILTCDKDSMLQGALIAYFADHYKLGTLSARKASYILKGAEPQWLFTDAPSEGILLINKKSANDLKVKLNEF